MWFLPLLVIMTATAFALRHTRWATASLAVSRWTYAIATPLSLLYFPAKAGFHVHAVRCEWTFDSRMALEAFTNVPHIVMMAIFFVLSWAQWPKARQAMLWAFVACFVIGFLVEIAEGATGIHHCKMRDLIPDMTGACIGAAIVAIMTRTRRGATA